MSLGQRVLHPAFLVAIVVLVVCALGMTAGIKRYNIYLRKLPIYAAPVGGQERVLRDLPTETARWKREGADHIESPEIEAELGTQNYVTRTLIEKNPAPGARPRRVQVHVAYYTGMVDTVPHVPERCFVGGGMSQIGAPAATPIPLDTSRFRRLSEVPSPELEGQVYQVRLSNDWSTAGGGRMVNLPIGLTPEQPLEMRVTKFETADGKNTLMAGYLFVANGRWAGSAEGVRVLSFDLRNDYAYYLKVQVSSAETQTADELGRVAADVLDDYLGEIMTCVPDWLAVERGEWPPDNPRRKRAAP
jgi:hypothetical protein